MAPAKSRLRPEASETILLAEDEPAVRALVRETLQQLGYTVLEATDGYEALKLVEEHKTEIHLLLTDVIMPLMNGHELATAPGSDSPRNQGALHVRLHGRRTGIPRHCAGNRLHPEAVLARRPGGETGESVVGREECGRVAFGEGVVAWELSQIPPGPAVSETSPSSTWI